jgi:tetratricopeptide (TPR) repeat protein
VLYEETFELQKAKFGPDHPETLNTMKNLAAAYGAAGKSDRYFALFEEALRLEKAKRGPDHPDTLNTMNILAVAYWHAKRFDRSIPLFEELVRLQTAKLGKDHTDTLNNMANLATSYREAGRREEALRLLEEAFERALKLAPFPGSLAWVGVELAKSRTDFAQAAADYAKLIDVVPNNHFLWVHLWETYSRSKQLDKALLHHAKAIEQKPDWAFGWVGRGVTFAELGEWAKAAADFARAAQLKDVPVYLPCYRALLCLRAGDPHGYRSTCTEMRQRWSLSEPFTLWTCVLAPHAVDDPSALAGGAEKVCGKEPKDHWYANLLGAALFRAGRYVEAAKQLARASALNPDPYRTNMIYTWFFLAMTHHRLGHAQEARQWLDKAVQATDRALDPSAPPEVSPANSTDPAGGIPPAWNRRLTLELLRREAVELIGAERREPELVPPPRPEP